MRRPRTALASGGTRWVRIVCAISCVFLTAPVPFPSASSTAGASPTGGWQIVNDSRPALGTFEGVTCPTTEDCYAINTTAPLGTYSAVMTSKNGGRTWSILPSVPTVKLVDGYIDCPTALVCEVLGTNLNNSPTAIRTTDGGAQWVRQHIPPTFGHIGPLSCATATDCVMLSRHHKLPIAALRTTDGGGSWLKYPTGVSQQSGMGDLTCPTPTICYAVATSWRPSKAQVLRSDSGGETWSRRPTPHAPTGFGALDCPNATTCDLEVNGNAQDKTRRLTTVLRSTDGGRHWVKQSPMATWPETTGFDGSLLCPSSQVCTLALQPGTSLALITTTDGGRIWRRTVSGQELISPGKRTLLVACASATAYVEVGAEGDEVRGASSTTNGGRLWRPSVFPNASARKHSASSTPFSGVSCSSARRCTVFGQPATTGGTLCRGVLATSDGGTTWQGASSATPKAVCARPSSTCPKPSDCLVVTPNSFNPNFDEQYPGRLRRTRDGGKTWAPVKLIFPVAAIDCVTVSICAAVGQGWTQPIEFRSTDGGTGWTTRTLAVGTFTPSDISCPSTTDCEVVGKSVKPPARAIRLVGADQRVRQQDLPKGSLSLSSVSCPSIEDCTAVGGRVALQTVDAGMTWVE
jgi:photosystem II stability/assembly factor-like uncharacterized protein